MTLNLPTAERFIIFCGKSIEPWVYRDEVFKITRSELIRMLVSGEPGNPEETVVLIMGFDLAAGKCWNATAEIMAEVRNEMPPLEPVMSALEAGWDHQRDLRKHERV